MLEATEYQHVLWTKREQDPIVVLDDIESSGRERVGRRVDRQRCPAAVATCEKEPDCFGSFLFTISTGSSPSSNAGSEKC